MSYKKLATTLGDLKKTKWRPRPVRRELRENLISKLKKGEKIFKGIIGYEKTVERQVINALLSQHDFILLGLRGQAKTRIIRLLPQLLDEYMPVLSATTLNEDPYNPISPLAKTILAEEGDASAIKWLHREQRFQEKLATPDISIGELIGDIDPIKAVREKLDISNENVINWGLIPRSNRGIFAINELPDLAPRIQVGLFNLLEEKDIQIRGFPFRLNLDILFVFSANPEDYTNRGRIVTPLKDRISEQIITHYPESLATAAKITAQESTLLLSQDKIPFLIPELIERVTQVSRTSEFVDSMSGVSQRLSIAMIENVLANAERRSLLCQEKITEVRLMDVYSSISAITGKVELLEQRGPESLIDVAFSFIAEAIKALFGEYFPKPYESGKRKKTRAYPDDEDSSAKQAIALYAPVVDYFKSNKKLELADDLDNKSYAKKLMSIPGLKKAAEHSSFFNRDPVFMMELVLEGLYYNSLINREIEDGLFIYLDSLAKLFQNMPENFV